MDILNSLFMSVVKEAKKKNDDGKDTKKPDTNDKNDDSVEDEASDYGKDIDKDEVKGQDYEVTDETKSDNKDKPSDDPTDYGGDVGDDDNPDDDDEDGVPPEDSTEYGDTDGATNDDPVNGEDNNDPAPTDEPTDYGDMGGGDEEQTSDVSGEAGGEDDVATKNDKIKKLFLYKDFIKLQKFIIVNTTKISNVNRDSFLIKEIDNQVIKNFTMLKTLITNYILFKYDNSDYNVNLLNYNNFVTLCKINVKMLKKVSNSNSNR